MRYFSSLAWMGWLLLTGLFGLACWYSLSGTQADEETRPVAWCGTPAPSPLGEQAKLGKTLFRNNCASCHAGDMKTDLTGPALGGSSARWAAHGGDAALYAWIRDSQAMIAADTNARAQALWAEWGPTVMNTFHNLTDEEIAAVLAYVEGVPRYSSAEVIGCSGEPLTALDLVEEKVADWLDW